MTQEQAITLAKKYKEMVAKKLPLKALYLYGSYSKGNHREDSDIDIAVVVDHLNDNYFEIQSKDIYSVRCPFLYLYEYEKANRKTTPIKNN